MQQARQDALRKTPRASSLLKYVEASPQRHAFMTEVARIAVDRNWSQEKLAAEYRAATGASKKFGGGNVDGHFNRKGARPPRPEVRAGYATALRMSEEYVRLLMEPGVPHKSGFIAGGKIRFSLDSVSHDLSPELAEPLFEEGALVEAIQFMRAHPNVFDACIYAAQLANARFKLMPESQYIPKLSLDKETFLAAGIDKSLWVKWSAVAETLSRHKFDLASRVRHKDARLIRREELLSVIFNHFYGALRDFDEKEYRAGNVKFTLGWNEWLAVEHLLKLIFSDRRWPISKMLERLHSDIGWIDFADMNDPDQQAWREEQEHNPDFQAARAAHEASRAE